MRKEDLDIIDDDDYDYDPDEEDYSDVFTEDDEYIDDEKPKTKSPPKKNRTVKKSTAAKKSRKNGYGKWLVAIILSCIPLVNVIWLLVKAFGKDRTEMKQWARALLTFEVAVCLITGAVYYAGGKSSAPISINSIEGLVKKTVTVEKKAQTGTDKKNGEADTSIAPSDTVTVHFTGGAAVQMTSGGTKYAPKAQPEDDNDKSIQSVMYLSQGEKPEKSIIVVCIHNSETMKNAISEENAKKTLDEGEKISGYESVKNSDFAMSSYVLTDKTGKKSYKYLFYGRKADYITVTSDEKLAIAAGYLS